MKTIIVLGMHRTATSMTARGLHKSNEVYMGTELLQPNFGNPEGYYENLKFLRLNDRILKEAGGSWFDPPSRENILNVRDKFDKEIKNLIKQEMNDAKSRGARSWGFKDPRTVLTIELYLPHLDNPQFILTYRNPKDVAKSLHKAHLGRFSIEFCLKLCKIYYDRLFKFITEYNIKQFDSI